MKKLLYGGIALVLLLALVFTNPGWSDYEDFARDEIATQVAMFFKQDTRFMRWMSGELMWPAIEQGTERDNFVLFSVYTFDFSGPNVDGGEFKYIGALGTFFALETNPLPPRQDERLTRPAERPPNDHVPGTRQAVPTNPDA